MYLSYKFVQGDIIELERLLLQWLRGKFQRRTDEGREYFEAPIRALMREFNAFVREYDYNDEEDDVDSDTQANETVHIKRNQSVGKRIQKLNLPSYTRFLGDRISRWVFKQNHKRDKNKMYYLQKTALLYEEYKAWCETCRYEAVKRDTFLHHLIERDMGATQYMKDNSPWICFEKEALENWLKKEGVTESLPQLDDDFAFIPTNDESDYDF